MTTPSTWYTSCMQRHYTVHVRTSKAAAVISRTDHRECVIRAFEYYRAARTGVQEGVLLRMLSQHPQEQQRL
jgi:hypothetical protein